MPHILVVGLGNPWRSDDSVGFCIIERLRRMVSPADADIVAGEFDAFGLLDAMIRYHKVIIVDAVEGGDEPGTIYLLTLEDARCDTPRLLSIHSLSIIEMLILARNLGHTPASAVIVGVQPGRTDWGRQLSSEVAAALPRAVALVLEEIRRAALQGRS